jgi:hypothetical protein
LAIFRRCPRKALENVKSVKKINNKEFYALCWFFSYSRLNVVVLSRYLLNPAAASEEDLVLFKFLGILFGVAVRTKKPLDLHLAPLVWKQLVGISLTPDDIEEVSQL